MNECAFIKAGIFDTELTGSFNIPMFLYIRYISCPGTDNFDKRNLVFVIDIDKFEPMIGHVL